MFYPCDDCGIRKYTMFVELPGAPYENTIMCCDECYEIYYPDHNAQILTKE